MTDWKESKGNFWKPGKAEDSISGILVKAEENVGPNNSMLYHIEQMGKEGLIQVWGSTVLDQRMIGIAVGQEVKITYKGLGEKGKGGKQAPHLWKVEYRDVEVGDIEDIDLD